MKRVFLYVRVSTEEQAIHGLSIADQTDALETWAKENGHFIAGTYVDAGISARKPASKRPALQRLLADAQAGRGELIVFTKLDRWFRNIAEYYKVQEILEQCSVGWKTIREDYDTTTAAGRLKINIMLSVAQDEADRTSERIKAINDMKRQKKQALTGVCPIGYVIEGKKFIKDPDTQEAVAAFFKKYMACGSIASTIAYMKENFGMVLGFQKANRILKNTCYYGRYFNADNMTPPYISKEDFDKIQELRRRIVRKTEHNRVYIFSGLVTCGECGRRMNGRVNTNQESYFYNCSSHYMDASGCTNNVNLGEKKIESFLLATVQEQIERWRISWESIAQAQKSRDYKAEISALRTKLVKLKELYLNDLITLEEYKSDQIKYTEQIDAILKEESSQAHPNIEAIFSILETGWELSYVQMEKWQKQEFWRILLKNIRIYKDRHIEFDFNL